MYFLYFTLYTQYLKKNIKSSSMQKTFSYDFPFFILFILLVDIRGIKPAPGDLESNFKKVGAIPCGCNTNGTV